MAVVKSIRAIDGSWSTYTQSLMHSIDFEIQHLAVISIRPDTCSSSGGVFCCEMPAIMSAVYKT